MNAMASQITGVSIVFSAVCTGADQGKRQSSAAPVTGEFLSQRASNAENVPFDNVIMKFNSNTHIICLAFQGHD